MTVATWTTAPIPTYALRAGDKVHRDGRTPIVDYTEDVGGGRVHYRAGAHWSTVDGDTPMQVVVPDEPVDGYNLWKPKPGVWPSGCVCVVRRLYEVAGNWETVTRDENCRGHWDHDFDEED